MNTDTLPRPAGGDSPDRSSPPYREFAGLGVAFAIDIGYAYDWHYLQDRLLRFDQHAAAAFLLGGIGFAFLVMRNRYPQVIYWIVLTYSVAISLMTNHRYTPVVGVWLAMRAVESHVDGMVRYVVLATSLIPSITMAAYTYSVTLERDEATIPILVTFHLVLNVIFWQSGNRRRITSTR